MTDIFEVCKDSEVDEKKLRAMLTSEPGAASTVDEVRPNHRFPRLGSYQTARAVVVLCK